MRTRPDDILDGELADALREAWDIQVNALEYVALGGGTHHWRTGEHWLSLDDLDAKPFLGTSRAEVLENLRRALQAAGTLRDEGLEFVMAPLRTRAADVLAPVGKRYALALYPFLHGTTYPWGQPLPAPEREQLIELLGRLHEATPLVAATVREVPVGLAQRENLEAALCELHVPWCSGPLAEPAHALIAQRPENIRFLLGAFDRMVAEIERAHVQLVLSHGEPHPSNVMVVDGRLKLLDWDTVGLAPPERDLWWLTTASDPLAEHYTAQTGRAVNPLALRLYRLRWQLDDLIWCVSTLRAPHTETLDTRLALSALPRCLEVPEWMH